MNKKVPLILEEYNYFLNFFSEIDINLSKRFNLSMRADEDHLTSLLCEMLDQEGSILHNISYGVKQLNDDLRKINSSLNANIALKTISYNKKQESNITCADLGIIIDYKDNINKTESFSKGILLQAKRLYLDTKNLYSLKSKYGGFKQDQHQEIKVLLDNLHNCNANDDCFRYLLYNPQFNSLTKDSQEKIEYEYRQNRLKFQLQPLILTYFDSIDYDNISRFILDYMAFDGIWKISSLCFPFRNIHDLRGKVNYEQFTLEDIIIHNLDNVIKNSFPRFLVFDLIAGDSGCLFQKYNNDKWYRIVSGQSPESNFPIQPRYVLNITITLGKEREN